MISSFFEKINTPVKPLTYDKPSAPPPLTGELLEKHGREISVLVSDSRVVKAVVKEPLEAQVGEKVVIERRQIEHMETFDGKPGDAGNVSAKAAGLHQADRMLERLQVPVTEESRRALENLEKHGLELTRSNVMALVTAKGLLDQVIGTMTPAKALQLLEKNIDVDRASLQDLARLLQESQEEKAKFSFLKFLGLKKDMSTAEAEKAAQKLYGQKMGRDAADAIKALDKQGMEITKHQVDRLLSVKEKVYSLRGMKEETLVETVKGKIAPTLENLYKLHQGMEKGKILADPSLAPKSTAYGQVTTTPVQLAEKDLKAMEGDIARQIQEEGLEATGERIRMAGVFLKNGVAVTGETLQRMEDLKEAVRLVTEKLDANMISALQKAGIAVGKQDIAQLAQWIREYEGAGQPQHGLRNAQQQVQKEALEATLKQMELQLANLEKLDEKQLTQLIRQGGALRLEQLAPVVERIPLAGLSEADQQALSMAKTLGRLSDMSLDTAALHLRRATPLTLEQLAITQKMLEIQQQSIVELPVTQATGAEEVPPPQSEAAVNRAVDMYLAQRGVSSVEVQVYKDLEALQALSRQYMPLRHDNVSRLYAIRGAVENLQKITLDEARQVAEVLPKEVPVVEQPLDLLQKNQPQKAENTEKTVASMHQAFQKLEVLEIVRQTTPGVVAFQVKNQLPLTPEALSLTIKLFSGHLTVEDFKTNMATVMEKGGAEKLPEALETLKTITLPQEMDSCMETVLNKHLSDLFPHASQDSQAGEQLKELARVLMEYKMTVNRENLQQLVQLTRHMDEILARLPTQEMPVGLWSAPALSQQGQGPQPLEPASQPTEPASQPAAPASQPAAPASQSAQSLLMKHTLQQLVAWLREAGTQERLQPKPEPGSFRSLARLAESMVTLQSLAGKEDRKESILSLLIKNAVPVSLEEVRHTNLFLQNKQQTGQLLGEMIDRLKDLAAKGDQPARQAAEQLVRLMEEATQQLKTGKGASSELYRETATILRNLEPMMQQMSPFARDSLAQTGQRLMNSLELQSQLNREDTVFQLPFMVNGQMQNLQLYFMNQKKNKKIDPNDMTVLLNFDTQHMGNLNVFVGVKYKKIVMKIGVEKQEDKEWLDARRQQLEEVLAAMEYEIKDLAYRVEEEQHLLTLAGEVREFRGLRRGQLDMRI